MHNAYKHSIIYFLLFSMLLLLSSVALFEDKIGFSYENILSYYLGNEENFTSAKTYLGILKIILPHILSFALFVMVLLHFIIFTKYKVLSELQLIIKASYISILFELGSPFLIINGFEFFAYLKILSFFMFLSIIIFLSFLLFRSIVYD